MVSKGRPTIGVLALQGDYERHLDMLKRLPCERMPVYTAHDLNRCDGLIIPGGESTTLIHLMKKHELWLPLAEFGRRKAVFGTCAGCIVAAREVAASEQDALRLIDITVQRNAYGRQVDSFIDDVELNLDGVPSAMEGVFIRAPKIVSWDKGVELLGRHGEEPVLARQRNVLVATFHPELTDDLRLHGYFLKMAEQTSG